jgi:hypothetical protein
MPHLFQFVQQKQGGLLHAARVRALDDNQYLHWDYTNGSVMARTPLRPAT